MDLRNVVEVFTNKSTDFMLEREGSASWVMSVSKSTRLEYCVCCRNDVQPREDDRGARPERRNEAFLVGKVSGIELVERQNDRNRYLIIFSEYAEVSVPHFRHGSVRNPVVYSDVDHCRLRGLDISKLHFRPMPAPTKPYARLGASSVLLSLAGERGGLSIAQAKEELAVFYDTPIEAIEITIRG